MIKKACGWRLLAVCGLALVTAACTDPAVKKARHLEQGKAHMASGRIEDAIIEFRNALKVDQRFGEARWELAQAYEKTGNQQALKEYVRAADLLPNRPDVQIKTGSMLLTAQQFEQARKHAELALKVDPSLVDAQIIRAYTLAGLKDMDGAVDELQRAVEAAPGDYRAHVSLGAVEAASGKMAEAEAAFKRAVEAAPSSTPAKVALAYFYMSTRRTPEAERTLLDVIRADEKHVAANRLLALLYATTQRPLEAEKPLLRLVAQKDTRATLVLGDLYLGTGRGEQARPLYESLKPYKALREVAVGRLAGLDFAAGRRAEALAAVDAQLKETPKSVRLLTLRAQILTAEGRAKEATEAARQAVAADSKSAQAQYVLGFAEAENRNPDAAIAAYNEALRLNPNFTAAQVELSRLLLATGKTDQALQLAQAARKAAPGDVQARINLTRALLQKGDVRQAQIDAKALAQQLPKYPTVRALYGRTLLAGADLAGAAREFDEALQINAADVDALTGRIIIDLRQKRPQDARARIGRAIAKAPNSGTVLVTAAQFERADGQAAAAEQYLRKAIDVEPANFAAYNQLASLYLSQKKLEEGKRELQALVERQPNAIPARTMIAIIDQIQGRDDQAMKMYDAILKEASTAAVAANNLAYIYAERGEQLDLAVQLAQTAKQQLPDHPDVSDTLGWAYYKRGMAELAVKSLEFSVQKDPKNPLYLVHLGLAYAKAGHSQKAKATLTQALQIKADVEGAAEARAVLASLT